MDTAGYTPEPQTLLDIIRTQTEIVEAGLDLGQVMAIAAVRAQHFARANGCVIELAEGDQMVYRAASGVLEQHLGLRLQREGSFSGQAVRDCETLVCFDSEIDDRVDRDACRAIGVRSLAVVPLRYREKSIGVIKVTAAHPDGFGEPEIVVLGLLADLIAAAMHQASRLGSDALYHSATHDYMTDLANRALFYDRLRQAITLAMRSGKGFGVLTLDMDGLKQTNDALGHQAGDVAIKEIAKRMVAECRETDTVARLGGDEFGIILAGATERTAIEQFCVRLSRRIAQEPIMVSGQTVALGASLGFALFPEDGTKLEDLLDHADQEMYEDKRSRKPGGRMIRIA